MLGENMRSLAAAERKEAPASSAPSVSSGSKCSKISLKRGAKKQMHEGIPILSNFLKNLAL